MQTNLAIYDHCSHLRSVIAKANREYFYARDNGLESDLVGMAKAMAEYEAACKALAAAMRYANEMGAAE